MTLSQAVAVGPDPRKRAAIVRVTASRLQSQLWAMPEYGETSLIVLYDEHADIGMWLVRPQETAKVSAWRIELGSGA